jgi:hypothetical protein
MYEEMDHGAYAAIVGAVCVEHHGNIRDICFA